jgi:hypothetical protein
MVPATYTQKFNGTGTMSLVLPEWPLLQLNSLLISGVSLSEAQQNSDTMIASDPYGWRFQVWDGKPPGNPAVIELAGGAYFIRGNQNIIASYRAGYLVPSESVTSPTYTPRSPFGRWATDEGVTYVSTGATLSAGTGTTSPGVGTYIPPTPEASPVVENYLFNSTDVSSGLLISYGYIPADVEQAALDLINERSAMRRRVDVRSQTLANQESITWGDGGQSGGADSGIPSYIRSYLWPYRSVLPPPLGANV